MTRPSWPLETPPPRPYVSSLRVDGSAYPSYVISGQTLARAGHTLTFGMTSTPSRIGRLDLAGTDGEVLSGSTDSRTYLRFSIDPLGGTSRADIHAAEPPVTVSVNGRLLPAADWSYHPGEHLLTLRNIPTGTVLLRFGAAVDRAGCYRRPVFLWQPFSSHVRKVRLPHANCCIASQKVPMFNPITHIYLHVPVCLDA